MDVSGGTEAIPIPPPWRMVVSKEDPSTIVYLNEISGEISRSIPYSHLAQTPKPAPTKNNHDINISFKSNSIGSENSTEDSSVNLQRKTGKRGLRFCDFRSSWRHIVQSGVSVVYSLIIRYYEDQSATVRFDNIPGAVYDLEVIEGTFGPITRLDLFVGATVKIFQRSINITSTTNAVCEEIEAARVMLLKKQAWLVSKIELAGKTPVIRHSHKVEIGYDKTSRQYGRVNLRQIHNENMKLCEQLAENGLSHLSVKANELFDESKLFWTSSPKSLHSKGPLTSSIYSSRK